MFLKRDIANGNELVMFVKSNNTWKAAATVSILH